MRQIFELGPLVVFFYFFVKTGEIQQAIMPLMIAAVIAIIGSYIFEKSVSYAYFQYCFNTNIWFTDNLF